MQTATKVKVRRTDKDSKGRWVKGCESPNPLGRPSGVASTKLDTLLMSISRVEGQLGKNLIDHFVKQAFVDNTVLISIMKKLCPDLKALEVSRGGADESMSDELAETIQKKLTERWSNKTNEIPVS